MTTFADEGAGGTERASTFPVSDDSGASETNRDTITNASAVDDVVSHRMWWWNVIAGIGLTVLVTIILKAYWRSGKVNK